MVTERYKHIRHIDDGGQGSVSLYSDIYLDRLVAVKTIKKEQSPSNIPEVNLLKLINSKHVVSLYDVIQNDSTIDIYQEYLGGEDLRNKVGNCSKEEFLSLAYQLAYGLADIHNFGICHRDIKLENIKFDEQGVLKIFDFGVSREGDLHSTINGNGTGEYRAPEIYELYISPTVNLTLAVDVFAYGVTLHKLAFGGKCNFSGFVPGVRPSKIRFNELGLDLELTHLLEATLERTPEDRPTSVQLAKSLEKEILKGKHVGFFVASNNTYQIDKSNPAIRIKIQDGLSIEIEYNGFYFIVYSIEGSVYINNEHATPNKILYGACVLTFVNKAEQRFFVSFSSSHPEIVL